MRHVLIARIKNASEEIRNKLSKIFENLDGSCSLSSIDLCLDSFVSVIDDICKPLFEKTCINSNTNKPTFVYSERGWSGGAMVLGKLPVPGRPTILITVGQGPIALAVGAGGGGLDIFTLIYPFSSFSLSLGDGPI